MAKDKPYSIRLEPDQNRFLEEVVAQTGLSKAFILRMAISFGMAKIDWHQLTQPPVKGEPSFHLNVRPEMNETRTKYKISGKK